MLVKSGVFCGWMSVDTISMPAFAATGLKASAPPRPKSVSSATIATVLNGFLAAEIDAERVHHRGVRRR